MSRHRSSTWRTWPRVAVVVLPLVAACTGNRLEVRTWDLRPTPPEAGTDRVPYSVRVEPFVARGGRESREVLVRRDSNELVLDPGRRWAHRPASSATSAVLDALSATGAFPRVDAAGSGGVASDLRLVGEVVAFEETPAGAEVELAAALQPLDGRLEPAGGTRLSGRAVVPYTDDAPSGRAAAMERALGDAAASLAAAVVGGASLVTARPELGGLEAAPTRLDLIVEPSGAAPILGAIAVRVDRFEAPLSVDRLELLERRARHRVEARSDVSWTRRPSEVVGDALTDTLRRALGDDGRVLRGGRAREGEVEVAGRLRRFELDATESPAVVRVELEVTVDGRSARLTASEVPAGDDPDSIAAGFARAVGEAVAGVPGLVAAAEPAAPERPAAIEEPLEVFLSVEAPLPAARDPVTDLSLGVARLSGVGGVDRLELQHREGRHVLELDPTLRWQRRPAWLATDGLVRALHGSSAFRGGVLGPGAPGDPALRLSGAVDRFEFETREGTRRAVVSLHLELRRVDAVARFVATGAAPVTGDAPSDLADAMGRALGGALADAVEAAAREARRLDSEA